MKALASRLWTLSAVALRSWLKYGEESGGENRSKGELLTIRCRKIIDSRNFTNVLQQIEHIMSYPFILIAWRKSSFAFTAWWFDIGHADVYCYEKHLNQFVLIDEKRRS